MKSQTTNTKYSSTKDITSKVLLKRMAADMANLLLNLDVEPDSVELLETEKERGTPLTAMRCWNAIRRMPWC